MPKQNVWLNVKQYISDIYKIFIIMNSCNLYQTLYYMSMATMCAYTPSQHAVPHQKFVLCFCKNFPHIDLPSQYLDQHHSNTCPTICSHHGFKVSIGTRYLDSFIRDDESKLNWLIDCTLKWENNIHTIREIAVKYPQGIYSTVACVIQLKWIFYNT